jgi:hypothetical protein
VEVFEVDEVEVEIRCDEEEAVRDDKELELV